MQFFRQITALLLVMFFTQQSVYGAVIPSNTVTVGAKTAVDKKIEFNVGTAQKPAIRANATTNALEFSNDGTGFRAIGSGSGGLSSYLTNKDFETDASGVSAYNNTAGTNPSGATPGAGGSPSVTGTRNTSSPLIGSGDLKLAKGATNRQGDGLGLAFTIPSVYTSAPQQIVFAYNATDANYVAGDVVACIVDATAQALIVVSGADVGSCKSIPKAKGTFTATFNATTSTSYRLAYHVATTNATAYNLFFDDISIGSLILPSGVPVSDWSSYTPTIAAAASTNVFSKYKRVGDSIEIMGRFDHNGSGTGSALTFTMPAGLTVDATKLSSGAVGSTHNKVGSGQVFITASDYRAYTLYPVTSSTIGFVDNDETAGTIEGTDISSGNIVSYTALIPVAEWSGSANIANGPQIEYAYNTSTSNADDTTSFANGPDGNTVPSVATSAKAKRVRFQSPIQPTDKLSIEVSLNGGPWTDISLAGRSNRVAAYSYQDASTYGIGYSVSAVNSTDIDVYFGIYAGATGSTYGAAGSAWSTLTAYKWRAKKEAGVASLALAEAVPGVSNGFLSYLGVKGRTDASSTAAGYVGEVLTFLSSSDIVGSTTNGTYTDITSGTITAGHWLLIGKCFQYATATSTAQQAAYTCNSPTNCTSITTSQGQKAALFTTKLAITDNTPTALSEAFGTSCQVNASYATAPGCYQTLTVVHELNISASATYRLRFAPVGVDSAGGTTTFTTSSTLGTSSPCYLKAVRLN